MDMTQIITISANRSSYQLRYNERKIDAMQRFINNSIKFANFHFEYLFADSFRFKTSKNSHNLLLGAVCFQSRDRNKFDMMRLFAFNFLLCGSYIFVLHSQILRSTRYCRKQTFKSEYLKVNIFSAKKNTFCIVSVALHIFHMLLSDVEIILLYALCSGCLNVLQMIQYVPALYIEKHSANKNKVWSYVPPHLSHMCARQCHVNII